MKLPKTVLDTNIYLSAYLFGGKPEKITNLALDGKIQVFISRFIFEEIEDKLRTKFEVEEDEIKQIVKTIKSYAKRVPLKRKIPEIISDPKDNPVLETAVRAKASYLVTGDRHLLRLQKHKTVEIVTPAQFLQNVVK